MSDLEQLPELVDPVMVLAFEGWNDAAEAASGAVEHLVQAWQAEPIAELDPEEYYDFQVNRPEISVGDQGIDHLAWPGTVAYLARRPGGAPRDVVLVHGPEPSMRWRTFASEIMDLATELGVEQVVTLGALLADIPHTRPIPVSGTAADPEVARALDLEPTRYEGPTGILGVLLAACETVDLPAVSLWAAVPHYVAQPPCPKATLALLRRIEELLDVQVPLGELPEDARAWERGVDELAGEDEEVADYVRQLEQARDTAELPEASGEAIAREFERYLRRRDGD